MILLRPVGIVLAIAWICFSSSMARGAFEVALPSEVPNDVAAQEEKTFQAMRLKALNEQVGARFDTVADPQPHPRRGYKAGQRVVYTIWLDNDDPHDGMYDLAITMPRPAEQMQLDLSPQQPAYGNIFSDSGIPVFSDTPANCRIYYISKPEGETRQLTPGTDPAAVRDVLWIITRGNSEQVVSPHNGNDNVYAGDRAIRTYGVKADTDQLYVRYAVIVTGKPGTPGKSRK